MARGKRPSNEKAHLFGGLFRRRLRTQSAPFAGACGLSRFLILVVVRIVIVFIILALVIILPVAILLFRVIIGIAVFLVFVPFE